MRKARLLVPPTMDDATVERIKAGFAEKLRHMVDFDVRRDASVIGGFIAYVDTHVYDVSIRTQLDTIRRSLDRREERTAIWKTN